MLSVSELSGRTVNYGYDNLYRLTGETIASDPNGVNGAVNYIYDAVGNRKQITSTLAPVPAGLWNYDANDRFTAGDTYDADGNTVSSGGIANVDLTGEKWSGRKDLNLRPPGPEPGALARLRYAPTVELRNGSPDCVEPRIAQVKSSFHPSFRGTTLSDRTAFYTSSSVAGTLSTSQTHDRKRRFQSPTLHDVRHLFFAFETNKNRRRGLPLRRSKVS
jgi:hypothetical protein